jgi:RES domain-containing protein
VTAAARWIRVAAFALIALMVLMPPLVRATQHVTDVAASQIRLNRGFDLPETRCNVMPALTQPALAAVVALLDQPLQILAPAAGDESLPGSPVTLKFEPLRGPPSIHIV